MKKILITGDSGLLGANLCFLWKDRYSILGISRGDLHVSGVPHKKLDMTDKNALEKLVFDYEPDVIIHTAALVSIEICESNPQLAYGLNCEITRSIAECARQVGAQMIHISTDAFYKNSNKQLAKENDLLALNSEYGRTKFEAEKYVMAYENGVVLRTNFFGFNLQNKNSFSEWILKDLLEGKTLTMTSDVYFSPIFANDLAEVIEAVVEQKLKGLYNASCTGGISKYDFAVALKEIFGIETGELIPISVDKLAFSAWRSNNMAMDNSRICGALNIEIPSPEQCIKNFKTQYDLEYGKRLRGNEE